MTEKRLLAQYVSERSQAAFSALAARHMGMVYSACLRELQDRDLAEDATQAVFVLLAKKAPTLTSAVSISGWLFTTARNVSRGMFRMERTRQRHERQAVMDRQIAQESDLAWNRIEPALNDALCALPESDRDIVLMRYFEGLSVREVAQEIGITENTAAKRLSRAIERLRLSFRSREVSVTSTVLSATLLKHAGFEAPHSLAMAISQASRSLPQSGASGAHTINSLFTKGILIMSTTKVATGSVVAVVLLLGLTFAIVQHARQQPIAPPPSSSPTQEPLTWDAPSASDPAAQQIQAQLDQFFTGFVSGDAQGEIAILSPDVTFATSNDNKPVLWNYNDCVNWIKSRASLPYRHANMKVTSFLLNGNTATVQMSGTLKAEGPRSRTNYNSITFTFTKTGGKWLITSMS